MKIKLLTIFVSLFFGCVQRKETKPEQVQIVIDSTGIKVKSIDTVTKNSNDTILLESILREKQEVFDINKDFEINTLEKSSNYPSSDTDTLACSKWNLSKTQIKKIILESIPINGFEWHHLFGHFPCQIHGKILQDSTEFEYYVNAGAWLKISSTDSTITLGSFKDENDQFFIDGAWKE